MQLRFSSPPATRLRQLLVLLLLALGLLAGVSVSKSRAVELQAMRTEVVMVPALRQVHELALRLDEQRGMAALHMTLRSEAERRVLEARLRASRLQLERGLAAVGKHLASDVDRRHHATVQAGLASFWAAQDKLLAASRRAARDPAAGQQARALLTGEAQRAFEQLRADIEAWWAATDRAAGLAASQARATAQHAAVLVWAMALLTALALAVAWALLRMPLRPLQMPTAPAGVQVDAAVQRHLQALNDAVAAARRGEPGRAAGLSALEAQRLVAQVDEAARGLRRLYDRPASALTDQAETPTAPD
jgi:hypothetical protein